MRAHALRAAQGLPHAGALARIVRANTRYARLLPLMPPHAYHGADGPTMRWSIQALLDRRRGPATVRKPSARYLRGLRLAAGC
jgi:hypothetical protein